MYRYRNEAQFYCGVTDLGRCQSLCTANFAMTIVSTNGVDWIYSNCICCLYPEWSHVYEMLKFHELTVIAGWYQEVFWQKALAVIYITVQPREGVFTFYPRLQWFTHWQEHINLSNQSQDESFTINRWTRNQKLIKPTYPQKNRCEEDAIADWSII